MKNPKIKVIMIVVLIVAIIGGIFSIRHSNDSGNMNFLKSEEEKIKEKNIDNLFESIDNIDKIKTAKTTMQLNYLEQMEEGNPKELMKFSFNGLYQNTIDSDKYLSGDFRFEMPSFDIDLNCPMFGNKIDSSDFSLYFNISEDFKSSFDMDKNQDFIFIDKKNLTEINKNYGLLENFIKNKAIKKLTTEDTKFKNLNLIEQDKDNTIYEINFDKDEALKFYELINIDENHTNIIYDVLNHILKDKDYIFSLKYMKGQFATNNDVLTDLYIELADEEYSIVAFRIVFDDINGNDIDINDFYSDNVKEIKDVMRFINIEGKDSLDQSENVITINDVFFTGRDEAIPLTEFSLRDDLSTINVFINFRECTAQTRLVIKWFYEEQTVPIVETKISNGDFVEGVLKSSISFSDETGILTGTYHLKIYIDGQEASIYEKDFNIID